MLRPRWACRAGQGGTHVERLIEGELVAVSFGREPGETVPELSVAEIVDQFDRATLNRGPSILRHHPRR